METSKSNAKDPAAGFFLSLFLPGVGHLYAGHPVAFFVLLAIDSALLFNDYCVVFAIFHVFQAIAAAGAVKQWNEKHLPTAGVAVPEPPPATIRVVRRAPPPVAVPTPTPPPPVPTRPLDPDSFLEELQAAWREHRAGHSTARQFADRKWRAVGAVRVEHGDDGHALVAAAKELESAGVLTSEEVGRIAAQVAAA